MTIRLLVMQLVLAGSVATGRAEPVKPAVSQLKLPEGLEARLKPLREQDSLCEAAGLVQAIDRDRNQLTVNVKALPVTLQIDKTTTIFVNGRTGTLDDVREGTTVRASYALKKGCNHAQWIEISKPAPRSSTVRPINTFATERPLPGASQSM